MSIENPDPQSEIKKLITKGREQGYLTYAEVNDHLPDGIVDRIRSKTSRMINDMARTVAPDAETLLLFDGAPAGSSVDDTATEEAAALSALIPPAAPPTRYACICARWARLSC